MTGVVDDGRDPLAGVAFAGVKLAWQRPGLVALWFFTLWLLAVVIIGASHFALATVPIDLDNRLLRALLIWPAALLLRAVQVTLESAAFRAVLRPDARDIGLLRFGAAERRMMFMNQADSANLWPVALFFGGIAGIVAVIFLVIELGMINSLLGVTAAAVSALLIVAGVAIANVRASLGAPAAFAGREDAQRSGWALGRGRSLGLARPAITAALMASVLVGLIVWLWLTLASAYFDPSQLWAAGLPGDRSGWTDLAVEIAALAGAISLAVTLATTIWSPMIARIWRILDAGGQYGLRPRALVPVEGEG